jgi:hypothetical protein
MKLAVVMAINKCDIGTRNRRKTGVIRISMMLETSKNRPTRLSAAGEKKVNCESAVGFFISSLPLIILYVESVVAPRLLHGIYIPGRETQAMSLCGLE